MIIRILDEVDSTHLYLKKRILEGSILDSFAVLARVQTSGIGTHGRKWDASQGDSFTLSLAIPSVLIFRPDLLVFFVSYVVRTFLAHQNIAVQLKWVNDIMYQHKKLAGILVEQVNQFYLIGIGMNLNQKDFMEYQKERISLWQIDGKKREPETVLHTFLHTWKIESQKWSEDTIYFWRYLEHQWFLQGKEVTVVDVYGDIHEGIFKDVASDGRLILKTENQEQLYFSTGTLRASKNSFR